MTTWGIVVAAGSGTRFGQPKHDIEIGGVSMWQRACSDLEAGGVEKVVVVGDVPSGVAGGARRQDSVAAGLAQVPRGVRFVLVHDAARPLAGPDLARAVIERLRRDDVDGVVPALPVRDTVKRVRGDRVVATVDRSDLAAVQTPQGFRTDFLRAAHEQVSDDVTDDAQMVEMMGGVVVTVPGSVRNLKVTLPEDLRVAEALL